MVVVQEAAVKGPIEDEDKDEDEIFIKLSIRKATNTRESNVLPTKNMGT